jgi:predicted ATPase with chaperone activity
LHRKGCRRKTARNRDQQVGLTARAYSRVLNISRTIADLEKT